MKPETALTETETVDCEPEDVPELPSTVAPPGGLAITLAERSAARRALKKSGLTTIKLDRIEAKSELGKHLIALSLFRLSATELVVTQDWLTAAIETTVTLDAELKEPEARLANNQTLEKFLKHKVELISTGFKAGAAEMQSQTQNNPNQIAFPANTQVTQVTVQLPPTIEVKS